MPVVAKMRTRRLRLFVRLQERLQRGAKIGLRTKLPTVVCHFVLALAFAASMANASPLNPGQIEVLDGDTIRIAGETFRLVGFDAPETYRAQCPSERELGNRATFRLRQLVADGGLDLERVPCACRTAAMQLRPLVRRPESARTGCGRPADRGGFSSRICVWAHVLSCSATMVRDVTFRYAMWTSPQVALSFGDGRCRALTAARL
jgi:hypothetical protein